MKTSSAIKKLETDELEIESEKPSLEIVKETGSKPGVEASTKSQTSELDVRYLIRALVKYNASDLHIKVGRPPLYRINGKLVQAKMPVLENSVIEKIVSEILTERQVKELEEKFQVDASFRVGKLGRFRCNVFFQRGSISATIRMIPFQIPSIEDLGIPLIVKNILQRPRGLVLLTGPTGAGKSTTLAAMVQHINENRHVHVLTIEDPIEFVFRDHRASITQREVGSDTQSFQDGLYAGLRQDPDLIVIGEMRDLEVIKIALTAAETGHLVLATMHTNDAVSTIDRIIDVFPAESKNHVRIQLASTLVAVISQHLLVRADGSGRIPACEVLVNSPTIENLIRKSELKKIPEVMKSSNDYYKMQTMNQDLQRLMGSGLITADEALKVSQNRDDLKLLMSGVSHKEGYDIAAKSMFLPGHDDD